MLINNKPHPTPRKRLSGVYKLFSAFLCLLASSILLGETDPSSASDTSTKKPNIILFLVDDMGLEDTSVPFLQDKNGKDIVTPLNKFYKTPAMEKLAQTGMKFTNAYAAPVCSPTRVSLMCGKSPALHRVTNWTNPGQSVLNDGPAVPGLCAPEWNMGGISPEDAEQSLPRLLKKAGYRTFMVGKAHFAPADRPYSNPTKLGFDTSIAGSSIGHPASYRSDENFGPENSSHKVPDLEAYWTKDKQASPEELKRNFLTHALTSEINKLITQSAKDNQPFFAYFPHYAVHQPHGNADPNFDADTYTSNPPTLTPGSKQNAKLLGNYATLIAGMDKSLGDLIKHLKELDIARDTLIVFMSDNGGDAPINAANVAQNPELVNNIGAVAPLRGRKGTPYEGGSRVPLIISWAQLDPTSALQKTYSIMPGSANDHIVAAWDLVPTIMHMAHAPAPKNIDGIDISPLLIGIGDNKRPNTITQHYPHAHGYGQFYSSLRRDEWKIIYNYKKAYIDKTSPWELYNLDKDPSESDNLADNPDYADTLKSMAHELSESLKQSKAQFPRLTEVEKPKNKPRAILGDAPLKLPQA